MNELQKKELDLLTVVEKWNLDAVGFGGGTRLTTEGELKLEDGLDLTVSNSHRFGAVADDRRYPVAYASGGIALGNVNVSSDSTGRKFELTVSGDGKMLYLVRKPNGFVLTFH